MQVSVESPSNLGRKLIITVPSEKIESAVSTKVLEMSKKVKIDGFRPGKVPKKVVEQRYANGIRAEVAHELLQKSLFQAINDKELKPAGTPSVEPGEIKAGHDFEFTASFDVLPEISIKEIDGAEVEQFTAKVESPDIESTINKLLEQHKVWNEAERAAQNGDKVKIDFDGYKNSEQFEGGKAENFDLELGSGSMIPGFESQIEGMKVGEDKDLAITFPEDYNHADLAGQDVIFKIKLHSVLEGSKPELNDEFVKQFNTKDGGVEVFKEDVLKNMERELSKSLNNQNKEKIFEAFITANPCELPQPLVDNEIEGLKKDMISRVFGNQKVDASQLPNLPSEMFSEQAKRRVHLGLLFAEYIKTHELKADSERVDAWLERESLGYDKPQELIDWHKSSKERLSQVEYTVLEDMAVEKMLESAKVINIDKDYDSVMNPASAPVAEKSESKDEDKNA